MAIKTLLGINGATATTRYHRQYFWRVAAVFTCDSGEAITVYVPR